MSALRGKLSRDKTIDVLLVIAIIISASLIVVPHLLPKPPPETTLHILTTYDVPILSEIENSFLASSYAEDNNIVDIEWFTTDQSTWNALIESNAIDLILAPREIVDAYRTAGQLRPISRDIIHEINESIAGVPMKGYVEQQIVWCSYAMRVIVFELLVNTTLLQEYGLAIPETVEELLSPLYHPDGYNSSLIGMDYPESFSVGYHFRNFITVALGWENGIQNLTILYANSNLYDQDGDALEALLDGEIGITLTMFDGQPWDSLPETISRVHLENMIVVDPCVVAIANGIHLESQSEEFIEYLLSPKGQAIWLDNDSGFLPASRKAFDIIIADASIYSEFNWIANSEGVGVASSYASEDIALGIYMDTTSLLPHSNLSNCWQNTYRAYENGSITEIQFNYFKENLGKPLTIVGPISHVDERFTKEYAQRILPELYNDDFAVELTYRWLLAANERYETILREISDMM